MHDASHVTRYMQDAGKGGNDAVTFFDLKMLSRDDETPEADRAEVAARREEARKASTKTGDGTQVQGAAAAPAAIDYDALAAAIVRAQAKGATPAPAAPATPAAPAAPSAAPAA